MLDVLSRRKRLAAGLLDAFGHTCFRVWALVARRAPPTDPRGVPFTKILVIRLDHIGDVVMATPLFRALRGRYPSAHITALVGSWSRDIVAQNPHIDQILVFDAPWWSNIRAGRRSGLVRFLTAYCAFRRRLRAEHFDLVLEPRGDFRHILLFAFASGAPHRIGYGRTGGAYLLTREVPFCPERANVVKNLALLEPLGITEPSATTEIFCAPADVAAVERRLVDHGVPADKPLVVVHPGARTAVKKWPAEKFAAVCDHLARQRGFAVAVVGGPEERELAQAVASALKTPAPVLAGELSLLELVALCQRARLFLCNDSGPMHLAAAAGVPILAVFGATNPAVYGYRGSRWDWVYHQLPCSPCHFEDACPYSDTPVSKCMWELAPATVIEGVEKLLARLPVAPSP